jgi:nitrogenase-stabilizing/protective protein
MSNLEEELSELSSAEDFLLFFGVPYDPSVVHVNRLHILQRYHDYLERAQASMPETEAAQRDVHKALLNRAYEDFVVSTAIDERVFKVLKNAVGEAFVPMAKVEGASEP